MSSIEFVGLRGLIDSMEDMGKKASKIQKEALEDGAEPVVTEAKSTIAWKDNSGELREAIEKSPVKQSKGSKYIMVGVWGKPYAYMLEYGTSKMAAKPWIGPAIAAKRGEAVSIVRRKIVEGLKL